MNVLSLFDGMSCGQIALKKLGIIPEIYYASEIDKHAIKQTQLNFPDTVQLGDVTKWKEWDIDWKSIDLLLAGSPCQGFSFAGKQLAFDDPRSKLFFVFIDILNHIKSLNPDVMFLLENVNMKKSYMRIISEYCGVFPVNINSNLVSAQNRDRWYWTNIRTKQVGLFGEVYTDIPQPEDKGIFLRDILEKEVNEKYYVSQAVLNRMLNPHKHFSPKVNPKKTGCLSTGNNSASAWEQNNLLCTKKVIQLNPSMDSGGIQPYQQDRIYDVNGISPALLADMSSGTHAILTERIRLLTPIECSRLQTVPEWYVWACSETQIYKMLGNGWTIDVIVHILSYIKEKLNINVA